MILLSPINGAELQILHKLVFFCKCYRFHFTVSGAGASSTILFTLDQISGFANFPNCHEAGIESCARVNLNFDAFDNRITIFGTSLQRNLENDLDMDTKFFEVTLL